MARFCLAVNCGEIVDGQRNAYCPAHTVHANWVGSKSSASGWAWSRIRQRVLRRDGNRCVLCGRAASEVDHIVPGSAGGSDDLRNLQSLCKPCHQQKTLAEAARGRAKRRKDK